ncbi:hypothetical protein KCU92_g13, partial [Aureobasidium melanogenum]
MVSRTRTYESKGQTPARSTRLVLHARKWCGHLEMACGIYQAKFKRTDQNSPIQIRVRLCHLGSSVVAFVNRVLHHSLSNTPRAQLLNFVPVSLLSCLSDPRATHTHAFFGMYYFNLGSPFPRSQSHTQPMACIEYLAAKKRVIVSKPKR